MTNNRASDAGTPKRKLRVAKTLAAASILSLAGMTAAHACNGDLTIVNNTDREMITGQLYTETDGGKKKPNFWSNAPYKIAAGASGTARMYTSRGKNVLFHIVMDSSTHGRNRSTNGRCRDGWTMIYN